MEQWKIQDTLNSIQSQMHEIERIMLRVAFEGCISSDTKRKVKMLADDVSTRFDKLPVR